MFCLIPSLSMNTILTLCTTRNEDKRERERKEYEKHREGKEEKDTAQKNISTPNKGMHISYISSGDLGSCLSYSPCCTAVCGEHNIGSCSKDPFKVHVTPDRKGNKIKRCLVPIWHSLRNAQLQIVEHMHLHQLQGSISNLLGACRILIGHAVPSVNVTKHNKYHTLEIR